MYLGYHVHPPQIKVKPKLAQLNIPKFQLVTVDQYSGNIVIWLKLQFWQVCLIDSKI